MSKLFSTFKLGGMTLANRIVVAPMCQYSAVDGAATDWHMMHLGQLAISGAGMMVIEATAVTAEGRITPGDLGIYTGEAEKAIGKVIDAVRSYSPIPIGMQLAHAGRKGSCMVPWQGGEQISVKAPNGWVTYAPSALPFNPVDEPPVALNNAEMTRIRKAFVKAAQRACRIGVDFIELHSAHGYLLHQFLSPLSNEREDKYGGSLQNRMRFPLEVFEAVRAAVPEHIPVGIRISATDWVAEGWEIGQSVAYCKELKRRGCAYIHVSSGGLSPRQEILAGPNYQIGFADRIRKDVKLPVIAVGLITEPEQAEKIINSNQADMVALARAMLYDPRWPWHAAAKLGAQVTVPPQYLRSPPHGVKDLFKKSVFKKTVIKKIGLEKT
ncbi:MAG TPA: NADH:flavin oxidoreductase/NADH oxidase [Methylophilaceae bacterium]